MLIPTQFTTPLVTRPLYLAVRRDIPDAASIVDRFNAQLRGMIADRTYHRLLNLDWIQADVDGDGLAEYVPKSDRAGALAPTHAHSLLSTEQSLTTTPKTQQRFLFGGNVYDGWTTVPDRYKVEDPKSGSDLVSCTFALSWGQLRRGLPNDLSQPMSRLRVFAAEDIAARNKI